MRVTTNIAEDLRAILRERHHRGAPALPGSWNEIGRTLQQHYGLDLNEDVLVSCEFGIAVSGTGRLVVEKDADGYIEIREVV